MGYSWAISQLFVRSNQYPCCLSFYLSARVKSSPYFTTWRLLQLNQADARSLDGSRYFCQRVLRWLYSRTCLPWWHLANEITTCGWRRHYFDRVSEPQLSVSVLTTWCQTSLSLAFLQVVQTPKFKDWRSSSIVLSLDCPGCLIVGLRLGLLRSADKAKIFFLLYCRDSQWSVDRLLTVDSKRPYLLQVHTDGPRCSLGTEFLRTAD